ncbi:deleted in lung and esophageal cancer protein 1-like isoform X1 [Dysidea avara]|uniref:deleted in lung and esophageal cancer protein 1-like isoform X1 n=1 Tax=Dysidea avara TaxID=196820 RepID=UPI00332BD690
MIYTVTRLLQILVDIVTTNHMIPKRVNHNHNKFGSYPADNGPVKRSVKLKNTSPSELMVDWEVYNKVPRDQQLIDLTVAVGKPFPVDITDDEESCDDDLLPDDVIKGSCDLIKVMIKAHEGVASSHPIRLIKLSSRDIQVSLLID